MHVEGAEARQPQELFRQDAAVVEREEEIGRGRLDARHGVGGAGTVQDDRIETPRARQLRHARKPARLPGIVGVRHHEDDVLAALQEELQTGVTRVRVGENRDFRHRLSPAVDCRLSMLLCEAALCCEARAVDSAPARSP